jgi:hypothetical protein
VTDLAGIVLGAGHLVFEPDEGPQQAGASGSPVEVSKLLGHAEMAEA